MSALDLLFALLGIAALAGAGAFVSFLLLVERAGRTWRRPKRATARSSCFLNARTMTLMPRS